ncbi:response regulator aspartate phosphatase [Bacillus sp. 105MF]|uniref:response regulator aspartate phosphatase n=1 Tax=Bacillus sp. 105MF TaxID=1151120 RepID=UPI00037403E8|nr:tetratricopeptide repeat protein [Bacillus sp. 105MF]
MNVQLKGNEQLTELLNQWYLQIRARDRETSIRSKKEIEKHLDKLKNNQSLLFYYSLLNFRYGYLIDNLNVSKNSFDIIETFETPQEDFLAYYYHFFKAIHSKAIGSYTLAEEHYNKAEALLFHIPDELEKAEFYYNLAIFHYHIYQVLLATKYVTIAKEIFLKNNECELKIAYCNNLLGLACTHLKEYKLAEEYFISAIELFRKFGNERDILVSRQNIGLMYAEQKQSSLAIRYLSEVNEKMPENYKALFVEAKQRMNLKETEIALELIEKGMQICNRLELSEYQHRFKIMEKVCKKYSTENLEKEILAGMDYFKSENLWEYVQEYSEILAVRFHTDANFEKASTYFFLSYEAKEKIFEKEALK